MISLSYSNKQHWLKLALLDPAPASWWGCSSVVERSLRMRKAPGSIPGISIHFGKLQFDAVLQFISFMITTRFSCVPQILRIYAMSSWRCDLITTIKRSSHGEWAPLRGSRKQQSNLSEINDNQIVHTIIYWVRNMRFILSNNKNYNFQNLKGLISIQLIHRLLDFYLRIIWDALRMLS